MEYSFEYAKTIIYHNFNNFLQYFLLFMIAPLLIIIDLSFNVFQIYISNSTKGWHSTIRLLFPHFFIEVPNMCLYMCLSYNCLKVIYKERNIKALIKYWKENRLLYGTSIVLIIFAGLVEGMVG